MFRQQTRLENHIIIIAQRVTFNMEILHVLRNLQNSYKMGERCKLFFKQDVELIAGRI